MSCMAVSLLYENVEQIEQFTLYLKNNTNK